jgi:cytochrome P450
MTGGRDDMTTFTEDRRTLWREDPGRIFVEAAAYADFDGWHEIASGLREQTPVYRVELPGREPFWALLRHADVMEVERNADVFTNAEASTLVVQRPPADRPPPMVTTLINMDGDDHRVHRGLINDWFKPASIRRLADQVEALARRAVDDMLATGGECDFAVDVAMNFPLRVILSILGLPESDYPRMLRLTQELFGTEDPDFARPDAPADDASGPDPAAMAVLMDFLAYFTGLTASRRSAPTADLASMIANAHIDGQPLADLETFGYYLIVATAGHDTTSSAIAGGLLALLEHPDQLAALRADPALITNATDEIVRWVSPVKYFMRTAHAPWVLSGTDIAPGDWVLLSYQSANRDAAVFTDPFRFDITRPDAGQSLGFGFGRHYCLGAHLAKLEIRALFTELLGRVDDIELAGAPRLMHSTLVSGPKNLPIRFTAR